MKELAFIKILELIIISLRLATEILPYIIYWITTLILIIALYYLDDKK